MGATSSKIDDDDKPLQLCRERKKFVRQSLDGRCALAAAHVAYIHSLKTAGTAIRKFVQPDVPIESSLYTSTNATPEPLALTEKSTSHFSFSSPSASQHVEAYERLTPSPPPKMGRYQVHRMNFRGSFTRKVEEKPPVAATATVTSLSTSQNTTPRSLDRAERSASVTPTHQHENPPWDYFGLFHPVDNHLSSHEQRELHGDFDNSDDPKHIGEDEEVPELEHVEDKSFSSGRQGSDSDEFDDPSSDTLVRSFKNLNREETYGAPGASSTVHTAESVDSEHELLDEEKISSLKLSPLKTKSPEPIITPKAKVPSVHDDDCEHKIAPKDFFSSMREVELLFVKASESGKEVPRMLEANKLHFRPLLPGQESGSSATSLLKTCFSCGEDPSQIQDPAQSSVKYLTWLRTTSFRSSSSRNFLDSHSREDVEDIKSDLFENFYMVSGSHASTLDRLFAWERKLYDEVKASQSIRREYDMKCKLLREQESKCESQQKIDKTRSVVKDLHSRIRVAIHRIDAISRRIEELRDKELQPQLEELIEGLRKMWEEMFECHKLQVHIITVAFSSGSVRLSLQSELRRRNALLLVDELSNLSSIFRKWINALKFYIQAINDWLNKCVKSEEKSTKKRRWDIAPHLRLRNAGPPIYTTCGAWLDALQDLPVQEVADTIRGLATEISHLVPQQEKVQGRKSHMEGTDPVLQMRGHESFDEWNTSNFDQIQSSFVIFLSQICSFAERSLKMYTELQTNIDDAKRNYEHKMSQP
ncbi:protein ROLLING AND ERECT LEAF 2 isoform X1 [Amaranthus tricolor]|uniref:protein ROLLING AND ERECT LEAF 2 isoform X1 n=1 Tax=Amaranthus tricolor TaxID=29722 RepID=UPI00258D3005|nr:protein ROLLING AND ERECT LEAF 2 isoform X1 [Amaranthus tricolor]XP_057526219.1 protein ROLLING AND ERECT LEAF 2 isoform X1 [Amaranthus tricolor]XP_057526223.1 protein ROLLING AND ERECT LEAF 2 isoform X1 [Amaranthus tricolor]